MITLSAEAILAAEVPREYLGAEVSDQIRDQIAGAHTALLLGPPGCGKTRQCWAYYQLHRLRQTGETLEVYPEAGQGTPLEQAQSTLGRPKVRVTSEVLIDLARYDQALLESLAAFDGLLCVDDIGYSREPSRWASLAIYHLANERRAHSRRTLWTTNLSEDALRDAYGPAIASRLCGGAVVAISGADRRQS